jgi:hypothetical protein
MSVVGILFLFWLIVFAMWMTRQFAEHNRRREQRRK